MQAEECRRIFGQVQDAARALGVRDIEAIISFESQALTRFANNAIHQNVAEREAQPLRAAGDRGPHGAGRNQPSGP